MTNKLPIIVLIPIILFLNISAMDTLQPLVYKKNKNEQNFLHVAALAIRDMTEDKDYSHAKMAAVYIDRFNIRVDEQDLFNNSAFDYADKNKDIKPHVYNVIQAGKQKQDFEDMLPKPDEEGIPDLAELILFQVKCPKEMTNQWITAHKILKSYLPK